MSEINLENVIEAFLFSSDKPLPASKIKEVMGRGTDLKSVKESIEKLKAGYNEQNRSFDIVEVAGGYQLVTKPEFSTWVARLYKKASDKIRGASMETLAIIVYKQPVTKGEIEAIRGVNSDGVVKTLLDKNLIKVKGRRESPGRPIVYGTTEEFLLRFGIKDLNSLPTLREFTEKDLEFSRSDESEEPLLVSEGQEETVFEGDEAAKEKEGERYEPEKTEN